MQKIDWNLLPVVAKDPVGWLSDALVKHAQIAGKHDFSELS